MSDTAKILLVDDEPGMLRYIRTLLEVDDYKVETASTGEEAVERVQKGMRPELVLLDLLMPGIDGLQTLEQLRKIQPNLKVVMLSCVSDTAKWCRRFAWAPTIILPSRSRRPNSMR
jgi:CheY-like chemotaxis protein